MSLGRLPKHSAKADVALRRRAYMASEREQCPARVLVPHLQGQTSEAFRQHIPNTEMIKHGSPLRRSYPALSSQ
jgi:hypothetical protein